MRNVLYPTDFSEDSKLSFRFMKMLVQKMNARLTIMNAYLDSRSTRRYRLEEGTIQEQADKRLVRFVNTEFHDESSENIRIKSDEGNPIEMIVELSKRRSFDLVALSGSKDFGWFAQVLGGRTARASRLAYNPILIIPPSERYHLPKNIMFIGNPVETNTLLINDAMQKMITSLNANTQVYNVHDSSDILEVGNNWILSIRKRFSLKARNSSLSIIKKMQQENIDMLVYRLEEKHILEQIFDYYYIVQKALNNGISVIVINDQTFKRL